MTDSITAALFTVTSPGSDRTHLCASSPAIIGTYTNQVPMMTICGRPAGLPTSTLPVHQVGCTNCLFNTSRYLELPGWTAGFTTAIPPTHPSASQR